MSFKMKYDIKKDYLTSNSKRRPGIKMPGVEFMVAHDTGNPGSTAEGNVGYYERSRNSMSASAHIFVDDNSIVECIPFLTGTPEKAWHVRYNVTKDNQMYGDDANDVAGGVELCWGSGINADEAYKRYIWVLAYSCYKFGINPGTHLTGHEILDPGRKIDPSNGLKKSNGKNLSTLIKDVVNEYNECLGKKSASQPSTVSGSTYKIKSGDTFWGIAQRTKGVSAQDLIKWNPHVKATDLKVGTVINLSKPKVAAKPAPKPSKKYDLPHVVLNIGDKGSNTLKVQEALCALYFYPEKGAKNNGADSYYGPKTKNAVMRFQLMYMGEDEADGVYGPKTEKKMESLLNK
jgi:N-acetylmuramoyl-L-alanine amidase CwlA